MVDDVAYRPAVVKLTRWLPRWWSCQFAHLSMMLDERWGTGYWKSDQAPPIPIGLCDACGRRAAWLVIGGSYDEEPEIWEKGEEPDYLDLHPIHVCAWCRPVFDPSRRDDKAAVDAALADARTRSIAWRWRPFA
jgi:hypothetical protein